MVLRSSLHSTRYARHSRNRRQAATSVPQVRATLPPALLDETILHIATAADSFKGASALAQAVAAPGRTAATAAPGTAAASVRPPPAPRAHDEAATATAAATATTIETPWKEEEEEEEEDCGRDFDCGRDHFAELYAAIVDVRDETSCALTLIYLYHV